MRWSKIGLLATAAFWPQFAMAQEGPGTADESGAADAEIVVTAQRYEQRLQDVPLSVTAVSDEEIAARNVTTLSDMQYAVPGLSSFEYGPGRDFVQIRGASNTLGSPTVGIYLDEMPVTLDAAQGGVDIRLLDLERVEVLRGPQATLYGEGSMGGTIRYITARPDLDEVTGSFEAEYGATEDGDDNFQVTGVLSVPIITDRLGVRLVANRERIGGYVDNVATGEDDINQTDIWTVRGTILARPTERLSVTLIGLHQEADQDSQNFGVNRRSTSILPSPNDDRYDLIQAIVDYDFDWATLTGSAGYIDRVNQSQSDLSPFFVPVLTAPPPFGLGFPAGFITEVGLINDTQFEVFNSELRLTSSAADDFRWLVGATYREIDVTSLTETSTAPGTLPVPILEVTQVRGTRSHALFGELSYRITPRLTILAGVRYAEEKKEQDSTSVNFGFTTMDVAEGTFDTINPRFNIQYEFSRQSMVYANVAKGFRSGGFNLTSAGGGVFTIPPTFDPDEIWTYEVGTKQQLFGNRLFLDAAVYYSDWNDVQSNAFAPGSPLIIVTNSGQVSGWGVDIGASARPVDGLTLSATYSWNNLEYKTDTADKLRGDPVDGAVQETWSASLDYRMPLFGNTEGFFRADYQHAGDAQITLRNFGGQIVARPSRDLVNLRLGIAFENIELSVFASNVFDEDAPLIVGPFGVLLENLEQRPRIIGVNARTAF